MKNITALILSILLLTGAYASARKTGYKLKTPAKNAYTANDEGMAKGSFMVSSQCEDCNNGYRLDQISFNGFDKPQQSNAETFFITNHTDHIMSGVSLYIEYMMPDGRQLHKRFLKLTCYIPPGETRSVSIDSWDKQRSFYYEKSQPSKRGGTPFKVLFDPIAFYLRF